MSTKKIRVLMVCMGNICRSPTAQGVLESLLEQQRLTELVEVDSAGTHAFHVGSSPDPRSTETAAARGFDLSPQRARKICAADFKHFDYLIAMDEDNLAELQAACPNEDLRARLRLFLDFSPSAGIRNIPDPYYGGQFGFERVLDLVEDASRGLLAHLQTERIGRT